MKKILTTLTLILFSLMPMQIAASPVYAVDILHGGGGCGGNAAGQACSPCDATTGASACDTPATSNPIFGTHSILGLVIDILAIIVGIVSVISIIISGVRMITANGDPNSIGSARKGIAFALAGITMAVLARVIVSLVINKV